ncbi:hypothetical protein KIL84_007318 [Mauremys mutica]|uniref:Peptidase S1 domain-containing protein n=1 Tax=Mauremys mutica TaxID=74926 RepID=A0A9D3X2U9_9SAUR|nr:hypothetical protein KIL84_007318 [Mauremys mutica]
MHRRVDGPGSSLPYSQYQLVLGAHQLLNPSPNQVLAEVQKIIPHPRYNRTSFVADIALVRLKKPVKFTQFIRPISLPGASRQFPVEKKCWVTSWGRVEVTAVPLHFPPLPGDSGRPLACEQGGTWYLAGIVSWFMTRNVSGIVCSHPKFPGVFTRVTAYDSWIQREVGPSDVASPAP